MGERRRRGRPRPRRVCERRGRRSLRPCARGGGSSRAVEGRLEESAAAGARAVERAEKAGQSSALAYALLTLDQTLTQLGRTDRSLNPRALEILEREDDLRGVARALNNIGINAYYAGD